MDTIQINITDIPNEVTINVSNLQGPPGPSGATATLQEVINVDSTVNGVLASSPNGTITENISDSASEKKYIDASVSHYVSVSQGGVNIGSLYPSINRSAYIQFLHSFIGTTISDGVNLSAIQQLPNALNFYALSMKKNGYEIATENYVTLENARTNANTIAGDINANSNTLINLRDAVAPQEPITKMQFDTYVSAVGGQRGSIDCSTNPNYPASNKGDRWEVTVAGKIGGALGIDVQVYDEIVCKTTSVAGDQATVGANFYIVQGNLERATETVAGYIQLATDVETQAGTENTKAITALKLDNWWTNIKTLAQTFAAKITFLTSPRISSGTASTVPYLDANKDLVSSSITPTQLSYLDATSSIQTQLNAKANNLLAKQNITITHTGTTAETKIYSILIPAGSVQANDVLKLLMKAFGASGVASKSFRMYFNTSDAIGGVQVGLNTIAATVSALTTRNIFCKNSLSSQQVIGPTISVSNEESTGQNAGSYSTISINFAVDQYFIVSCQLTTGTESASILGLTLQAER